LSLLAASLAASLTLGVLVAQPAASSARVEREIVCIGPLPFSKEELQEALLVRWQHLGGVSVVRVRGEDGRTSVQVGPLEREVDLEGREGEEAARIVAVMALDLAQARAPFAVSTPAEGEGSAAPGPKPTPSSGPPHNFRTGLLLLGPVDQAGLVAHLEPTLDIGWEVVPGFGAFMTAGYRQATSTDVRSSLILRELPFRAGLTVRRRWLELRAGGIARSRFVEGPRSYRALSWGAAVSVVARLALTSKIVLLLTGGVDLFRTRLVFALSDDVALTTPWFSPWLGAGIAWETTL
jgi:hypothetical protein